MKPCLLLTSNIIKSYAFPESLIYVSQVIHKTRRLSPLTLTVFIDFLGFYCCQETDDVRK